MPTSGAPTPVVTGTLNPSVADNLVDNCDIPGMPGIKDSSGTRCCPQVCDALALLDVLQGLQEREKTSLAKSAVLWWTTCFRDANFCFPAYALAVTCPSPSKKTSN